MTKNTTRLISNLFISPIIAFFIFGCSDNKIHSSQVAAKVNGEEISIHQVNNILSKIPSIPENKQEDIRQQIIEKLVDQKIYEQKATEMKLDRSPEVILTIEMLKGDVIANAYKQKIISSIEPPTLEQSEAFVNDNPLIFKNRQIFETQEIIIERDEINLTELQSLAQKGSMEDIQSWLTGQDNIKQKSIETSKPSEKIPQKILPTLIKIKNGNIGVFETETAIYVIKVISSRDAPIKHDVAIKKANQLLLKKQSSEALKNHLEVLKTSMNIEYPATSPL